VSDDTTTAALPSSVMNSRLFHQERTFSCINGPGPNGPTFTPISAYAGLSADLRRQLTETKIEPAAEGPAPLPPVRAGRGDIRPQHEEQAGSGRPVSGAMC
jgi:hypothetical protein